MKILLPPLNALRAFESAARHESFSLAAVELSVTHGAISRQVALLEEHLGVLLFERGHRQVRLTRAGSALRDEVTASLLRIAAATARVRDPGQSAQRLRVSAPPAFSVRWLIPRLSGFQRERPGIEVSLTGSVASPDFANGLYDLAIRRLDRAPRQVHSRPLFAEHSIPVARTGTAQVQQVISRGRARSLQARFNDLIGETRLIRVAGEPRGWTAWARRWDISLAKARFLEVEQTYLSVQAVMEGLGVALLPFSLVCDDLDRETLHRPLGTYPIDSSNYYLITAHAARRDTALALLGAYLQREGQSVMGRIERDAAAASVPAERITSSTARRGRRRDS
jgi:LysR family glycine cleavage system transcriptional activator